MTSKTARQQNSAHEISSSLSGSSRKRDTDAAPPNCALPLRAAYQLAVDSGTDPDVPLEFGAFGITVNPVASVSARSLAKYNRARERTLSAPELTAFLERVDAIEQVQQREALKLCLFLGGQRPTQLLRTIATDIDIDAGSITLHDKKVDAAQDRAVI